jgi:signal transduction histidine kinase
LAADVNSFRLQETIFAGFNLLLIGMFLAMELVRLPLLGSNRPFPTYALAVTFVIATAELLWLRTARLTSSAVEMLTWWLIVLDTMLVTALLISTAGQATIYYALMTVPVLAAAFRLRLPWTVAVVTSADLLNAFNGYWLRSMHEYLEAGAASLIFTVAGITLWLLVNSLRERQVQLERMREQLAIEEKLAAVGRLSSAIAHEIRNPVAMLSSSLAMAERVDVTPEERKEMFGIAAGEASRLERLTSDFLAYARPRATQISRANVSDILAYVVSIAQARANDRGVALVVHADSTLEGDLDSAQMHQALLNLVLNAIDACGGAGPVILSASRGADGALKIDVSNPDGPIPPETAARLFEPFFTTKPGGTGLGLAIARNIARLHRGDLALSINKPGLVCFSIAIPRRDEAPHASG